MCIDPTGDVSVYWPKQVISLCTDPNRYCVCVLTRTDDVSGYLDLIQMICLSILTWYRLCLCFDPNRWYVSALTQTGDVFVYWPKQVMSLCIDPHIWYVCVYWPHSGDVSVTFILVIVDISYETVHTCHFW